MIRMVKLESRRDLLQFASQITADRTNVRTVIKHAAVLLDWLAEPYEMYYDCDAERAAQARMAALTRVSINWEVADVVAKDDVDGFLADARAIYEFLTQGCYFETRPSYYEEKRRREARALASTG